MAGTFTAQIDAFVAKSKAKVELVFKQSAQDVFSIAQTPVAKGGRMPVDTGFLRNSFVSGLNGQMSVGGSESYSLVIAGAELGDVVQGGWTANYAIHVEYGTSRMAGRFYALGAAQEWQRIVAVNVEKAKRL